MAINVTLRKLSAVAKEIQNELRSIINEASSATTATVLTNRTQSLEEQFVQAVVAYEDQYKKAEVLQTIFSRVRNLVGEQNIALGVNKVLQEIRETEDRISLLKAFDNSESKASSRVAATVADAEALVVAAIETGSTVSSGLMGRSTLNSVTIVLPSPTESLVKDLKELERNIKTLKNETLLALNATKVTLPLSEEEQTLLEDLNIL